MGRKSRRWIGLVYVDELGVVCNLVLHCGRFDYLPIMGVVDVY